MKKIVFDKVYILGAGAIGSIFGALLSQKNNVILIGSKSHIDKINEKGLSISGSVNKIFNLKTDVEIQHPLDNSLIILTTKAHDSYRALKKIKNLVRKSTIILIIQNGLGIKQKLHQMTKGKILRGITTIAAEFFKPGKIKFWDGETIIEHNAAGEQIAETFNKSDIKTMISKNIQTEIWKKMMFNCVINPLTALFQVRNCEICNDTLEKVREKILDECIKVGKAENIIFPAKIKDELGKKIPQYTNFSSMYQDIIKNKKTEIEFLNGKIVELGEKHNIPTPVNETLVCFIKYLEEKNGIPRDN
jgi:2-dehydropantoate 2-reductase